MRLFARMLINTFKVSASYRLNYLINLLFSFFFIVMTVSVWQALYKNDDGAIINGVALNTMIAYSLIAGISNALTGITINDLSRQIKNGQITNCFLFPRNFICQYFRTCLSKNIFSALYAAVPPAIIAWVLYGFRIDITMENLIAYLLSLTAGLLISFLFRFMLGLATIWLKNDFFLWNLDGLFVTLLSGAFVPLWFFPDWLNTASYFLPFRYVMFEPTSMLLGQTAPGAILWILLIQAVWVGILLCLALLTWSAGQKKLYIYGG